MVKMGGCLVRWIAAIACGAVVAALSGCPKPKEAPELITATDSQPIRLKSSDGLYSLQVQGKQFVDSLPRKEEVAATRVPGISTQYVTMLYEATETGNGMLVYGASIPKADLKDKSTEELIASEEKSIKDSPKSWGYKLERLKGPNGDDRYLVSGVNDVTGAVAYETCVGRLKDRLLYVCILTEHEQPWVRSALIKMVYH